MSNEQTKELLYNILQALQRGDADYAETLAQGGIARINAQRDIAQVFVPGLSYEPNGDLLFAASTQKKGR